MKKTLAMMLAMIMVLSTVVIGISTIAEVTASAEGTSTYNSNILNLDSVKPTAKTDAVWNNIYGTGNTPFLLSEQHELYLINAKEKSVSTYTYDNLSTTIYEQGSDGTFIPTPNASNTTVTTGSIDGYTNCKYGYRYVKGVGFDPTGTGRKGYAAYVGAVYVETKDSSWWEYRCFIVNPKTGDSYETKLGNANWLEGNSGQGNRMSNFIAITAGDYDNDQRDSAIVYYCGDSNSASDTNYKLFEIKFDGTNITSKEVLDLTTVISNTDIYGSNQFKHKPIVSLATGDFDGDQIDEFAYSVGFHNTSGSAKDGWSGKQVTSMDYFSTKVGICDYEKAWKKAGVVSTCVKGNRTKLEDGVETYPYTIIQGGAIAAGNLDGEGADDIVLVGYSSYDVHVTIDNGIVKAYNPGDLNKTQLFSTVITYDSSLGAYGHSDISPIQMNEFTKTSCDYWKDDYFVYPQIAVECVATNGRNQVEDVFVSGTFYSFKSNAPVSKFDVKVATQHFTKIFGDEKKTDCYWFGNTAVGNFDHNEAGREQIYYGVNFKNDDGNNYNCYIGFAGGGAYSDTLDSSNNITSFGSVETYACSNTRGGYGSYITEGGSKVQKECNSGYNCVAPVAVDIDDDGLLARYHETNYVYTDPEVVAVLQAAPKFGKLDELGGYDSDGNVSYSIETTSGYSTSHGNNVSFEAGFNLDIEAGCSQWAFEAGYSLEYNEETEDEYETTYTTTWNGGSEDIVCMIRIPIIVYRYDIYQNDKWYECAHEIEAPLAPVKFSMSIDDYNDFVDEYNTLMGKTKFNKITAAELPQNTDGNPFAYYSGATTAGNGAETISNSSFAVGYGGGSMEASLSSGSTTTESTSYSHGFHLGFEAKFGGGVDGAKTYGGFHLNLEYTHSNGYATISGGSKSVTGSVANISAKNLSPYMTSAEVKQYGFSWELGKWTRDISPVSGVKIPFYGYFVHDVTAPLDPPTGLTAAFTNTDANTSVKLEWTAPETVIGGPKIIGYYIYDNGEQVNSAIYNPSSSSGKITYIHNGISYGSKHNYTVKAVSELDGKKYYSVDSSEVTLGWVTTGNIIQKIYKDETYTSADGLIDRYVIEMSDGSEFAFFVTNGKNGANGTNGTNGTNGIDGKTAYEIAVANGYKGTQQEWLNQIGASCSDGHTYKTYSIPATCNSQGITIKVCELCGYAESSTTDKDTHSYKAYRTVEATCTTKGYTIYKCEKCNDFYYDNETDCIAHTTATKTVSSTCNTEGTSVEYCTVCGYIVKYDISSSSGHSYVVKETVAPTCISKGYTVSECSACGEKIITDEKPVAAHDYTEETTAPTCTGAGFTLHTCKNCDNTRITGYTPATGHNYKKEVTAPTCSQKGYTTYTCQTCGENHITDVKESTSEHKFNDKVVKNTCISDGYTIHLCEECGYQQIIDEKDAKGHNYEASQVIPSTCTTKGYTIYNCKDCGASYKGDEKDFSEHVEGGWVCDNATTGHYIKKCEKCGEILDENTVLIGIGNGTSIKNGDVISIDYGEALSVAPTNTEGSNVVYTSTDTSVATVDENGIVTTKNSGSATIIVTDTESGISTSFDVNVKMTWWQRVHKVISGIVLFRVLFELFNVKY